MFAIFTPNHCKYSAMPAASASSCLKAFSLYSLLSRASYIRRRSLPTSLHGTLHFGHDLLPIPCKAACAAWFAIQSDKVGKQHQQKTKVKRRRTQYSQCIWWSRRIERKLASWVCSLLLGACGQGSMLPGRTRGNQGLRRYQMQKGSQDAELFSGRNPIG